MKSMRLLARMRESNEFKWHNKIVRYNQRIWRKTTITHVKINAGCQRYYAFKLSYDPGHSKLLNLKHATGWFQVPKDLKPIACPIATDVSRLSAIKLK